ncbi:hypothetical protein AC096_08665 [Vibrio cholerae]|nr:hypothetical protein AC096_08665 [Vibrio cholerae]HAS7302411.1 hypothetical protein [Vibrio cholerae]
MRVNEDNFFIASHWLSLSDLLRTTLSRGKTVHLQNTTQEEFKNLTLAHDCEKAGIVKISFSDGSVLQFDKNTH